MVGALGPIAVSLLSCFVIRVTYPEILASSCVGFAPGFGTMVLELGACVFSGAAEINVALVPIMPKS